MVMAEEPLSYIMDVALICKTNIFGALPAEG
jgi:hypothetical protein